MNATSTLPAKVGRGGRQVAAHAGLHALGSFADRLDFGKTLSAAIPVRGERLPVHDRGKVLVQAMLMLAGGGETCSDIEHLRAQPELFGAVPSDSTLYRTFRDLDPSVLAEVRQAVGQVRRQVWRRSAATTGSHTVVLDIDASLVQIHTETKEGTAPNYKGGYGFHPLFCFADATGDALAALLRPGNAAANSIEDHLTVLDAAVAQLPEEIAAGHRPGGDPALVQRPILMRADSAGCSARLAASCRDRNIGFAVVARTNRSVHAAISRCLDDDTRWTPALTQAGDVRKGAAVAELTDLVDLADWPDGTRLIVRREPLHPGARHSLFPSYAYRYWGHYTDAAGTPVDLDVTMRAHARVEDHIARLKTSGLERFPFHDLAANNAWLTVVCAAADLVRWFQHLCLTGPLARANPKRLRWQLWHTPARLVRSARQRILRLLDTWPTTPELHDAYKRIARIT